MSGRLGGLRARVILGISREQMEHFVLFSIPKLEDVGYGMFYFLMRVEMARFPPLCDLLRRRKPAR